MIKKPLTILLLYLSVILWASGFFISVLGSSQNIKSLTKYSKDSIYVTSSDLHIDSIKHFVYVKMKVDTIQKAYKKPTIYIQGVIQYADPSSPKLIVTDKTTKKNRDIGNLFMSSQIADMTDFIGHVITIKRCYHPPYKFTYTIK